MPEDPVHPEECLRSLAAKALLWAHPDRPLFPDSLRLMAVANAFVMLGLLPEPRAEAILAEHRSALAREGLGNTWGVTEGELTVRPGADGYWQARMAGPGGLREVPLLAAVAGVCCPTSVAEVCFTWVKLTSTGWQLSFRATAADPDPYRNSPAPDAMGRAMSEISLTDDAGRSHDLRAAGVGWSRDLSLGEQEWHGHVVVARDPASRPAWFELAPAIGGGPGRVAVPDPGRGLPGRARAGHHHLDGNRGHRGRGGTGGDGRDCRHGGRQPDRGGRVAGHQHPAAQVPRQRPRLARPRLGGPRLARCAGAPVGPPRPPAGHQVPGGGASPAGRPPAAGARHGRDRERLRPR